MNCSPRYVASSLGALLVILIMTQPSAMAASPKSSPKNSGNASKNPLLTESSLPYHLPPFDKIKDDQFIPAMEQGMRQHLQEVQKIASNPDKATFDNTIVT